MADRNTKIRGTQIHDEAITEAKLAVYNAPTNGYVLTWNTSESKFEWKARIDAITEYPSGLINGSNKVFTLSYAPESGSLSVYLNGLYQEEGSGNDYVISGSSITFIDAPQAGDLIIVSYATDQIAGGGGASELNELSDVTISSPSSGQILSYNGAQWVNSAPASTSYTEQFADGDLDSNDVIRITHNLGTSFPLVVVYDNSNNVIVPSEITYIGTNNVDLDFTGMTPLTGNYNVRVIA